MNDEYDAHRQFRTTMLAAMFALFLGGGFLLFLTAITGGAILLVPIGLAALGLIGAFHYFLWGRSMSQATEEERIEEQRRRELEVDEWDAPMFKPTRRF
ncbi:MAG TPA: hypothetical protein VGZ25_00190 [Gemmataceae bacterium]|jgi:hypothetical protein|nr:hypothetical protein [Gemmataceae bacterium]